MTQFQTTLATVLTQQGKEHAAVGPLKVFAQDETRLGLLPVVVDALRLVGSNQ